MDIQMKAEEFTSDSPIWDLKTEGGIVPIISDNKENIQQATLACFLEQGTIPRLEDAGIPWTKFLTNELSFGELDALIRESIRKAGQDEYRPEYYISGDKLLLEVTRD